VGKVVRVTRQGLAYLSTGSESERRDFPFTSDKIRKYRGQEAREIGLRKGVEVRFSEKACVRSNERYAVREGLYSLMARANPGQPVALEKMFGAHRPREMRES
jgi:hypothetical protein